MSSRGFTILEVILALVVAALAMATLSPALLGALRAERRMHAILDPLADEQNALAELRDDLLSAPRPVGSLAVPFVVAPATVDGSRGDSLTVFTLDPLRPDPRVVTRAPTPGQAVVAWTVEASPDGSGLRWRRTRRTELLAVGTVPDPAGEVVLDHLAMLGVEAWIGGAFATSYDSSQQNAALPAAIRVTWARRNADGSTGPVQTAVIDLPMALLDPAAENGA
jgi:prepilin-type N-terminal cleavage/methylation domain-containing protein